MSTLSLCMIVKNEEDTICRCLNSCKMLFDEIIIVDTGSTDKTKEIAKKFTSKVYDFKWQDNFSLARNFSFQKATSNYIMWLDADDVIPKKSLEQLLELKQNLNSDVYMLKYNIAFLGKKPTFSYFRERIVKNCKMAIWNGEVHECITPFGQIERKNIEINHKKLKKIKKNDRNLKIYQKILKNRDLSPREQYYYARELFDHGKINDCIKELKRFVKSGKGWVENIIDALCLLSECYKLKNDIKNNYNCLVSTFFYDFPRANACCKIGDIHLEKKDYLTAINWYKIAITCPDVTFKGGFVEPMFYNYYPYLQMCYCYYCLNDLKNAEKCNKNAKKYLKSEIVLQNEEFFKNLSKNKTN